MTSAPTWTGQGNRGVGVSALTFDCNGIANMVFRLRQTAGRCFGTLRATCARSYIGGLSTGQGDNGVLTFNSCARDLARLPSHSRRNRSCRGVIARRRPFQGVNNLYQQLLTGLRGSPKYGEIRVKRANHGWGITGGDSLRCAGDFRTVIAVRRSQPSPGGDLGFCGNARYTNPFSGPSPHTICCFGGLPLKETARQGGQNRLRPVPR